MHYLRSASRRTPSVSRRAAVRSRWMTAVAGVAAMALVAAPAVVSSPDQGSGAAGSGQAGSVVLSAPVVAAHSALVSTAPEQDATIQEAPQRVTATFNEDISPEFAHLTVMLDGTNHAAGEPQVSGREVSVGVDDLPPGSYTVGYRVVSADGHPVQGSWSFTLAGDTGAAAPTGGAAGGGATGGQGTGQGADQNAGQGTAEQADAADSDQAEAPAADQQTSVIPAIAMLAVLAGLLIGGAFFLLRRQRKLTDQFEQDFS